LPNSFWAETINATNFIRRMPNINNKTSFEIWYDQKPYVSFGCKAITLIKGVNKGKFEAKGRLMTMIGYSSESKAYRLW